MPPQLLEKHFRESNRVNEQTPLGRVIASYKHRCINDVLIHETSFGAAVANSVKSQPASTDAIRLFPDVSERLTADRNSQPPEPAPETASKFDISRLGFQCLRL